MKGIPAELNKKLRAAWRECATFEDEGEFRALFTDERIAPWRDHLPTFDGLSQMAQIESVIDFLYKRRSRAGKNGLVLFLRVWQDETDPADDCCHRLAELAAELERVPPPPPPGKRKAPGPGRQTFRLGDLQVILRPSPHGVWQLQAQNLSRRPLKKVVIFLHPGATVWTNKHKLSVGVLPEQAVSAALPFTITLKQAGNAPDRSAYELGIEVVYQPQSGGKPIRMQKSLDLL